MRVVRRGSPISFGRRFWPTLKLQFHFGPRAGPRDAQFSQWKVSSAVPGDRISTQWPESRSLMNICPRASLPSTQNDADSVAAIGLAHPVPTNIQ
jgi:hypothetical protein